MSQKLHLHTGVFRIHWLDIELLGPDDLNLFILVVVLIQILLLEIPCRLFLVHDLVLVFPKLTLDNLFYQINGYIHIVADLLRTDNASLHGNRNLDLLSFFFHT